MSTATVQGWVPADTLPTRLVLVRHHAGLSQREAAARCGLSYREWQGLEEGRSRQLDQKVLMISRALGVSRDWLMWGGPLQPVEPPPPPGLCAVRDSNPEPSDQVSTQLAWGWAA